MEAAGPGGLVGGRGGCRCEGHCRGSDSRPGGHSGLGSPGKWALTGPQVPTQGKWARSPESGSSERKNLGWTCPCHWRALDGVSSRDQEGALFPIPLCQALYRAPGIYPGNRQRSWPGGAESISGRPPTSYSGSNRVNDTVCQGSEVLLEKERAGEQWGLCVCGEESAQAWLRTEGVRFLDASPSAPRSRAWCDTPVTQPRRQETGASFLLCHGLTV